MRKEALGLGAYWGGKAGFVGGGRIAPKQLCFMRKDALGLDTFKDLGA